jgi:hypothetical protein
MKSEWVIVVFMPTDQFFSAILRQDQVAFQRDDDVLCTTPARLVKTFIVVSETTVCG